MSKFENFGRSYERSEIPRRDREINSEEMLERLTRRKMEEMTPEELESFLIEQDKKAAKQREGWSKKSFIESLNEEKENLENKEIKQRKIRREQEIEQKVVNRKIVDAPDDKVGSIQEIKTEQMIREAPSTEPIIQNRDPILFQYSKSKDELEELLEEMELQIKRNSERYGERESESLKKINELRKLSELDIDIVSNQEGYTEQLIREVPSKEPSKEIKSDALILDGEETLDISPQTGNIVRQVQSENDTLKEDKGQSVTQKSMATIEPKTVQIEFVDLAQIELFKDVEDEELVYEMEDEKGVYVVYQLKNGQYYDTYVPNEIESIDLKEYATKSYQFRDHTDIENFTYDIIKGLEYYYNMREMFRRNCYYDEMSDEQLDQLDNYIDDINKVVKAKLEMAAKLAPAWYHGRTPAIPNFYYRGANPHNMHGVDHKYDYLLTPEEIERFPLMRDIQFSIASSSKPVELSEGQIIQIQHGNIIDKKRQEFRAEYSKSIEDNVGISDENNDYEESMTKSEDFTKESDVSEKKKEEQKKMSEEKEMYITMQELAKQNKELKAENEQLRMMLAKYQNVESIQNPSYENEDDNYQI